ncbi:MAG: sigma-70 family RNA polymerase sigma factor [Acidobacteriota bacterium]|nr:MAG: sigma-70 family RNA polymerase sigma factor [Acidobacteriota bacterium]
MLRNKTDEELVELAVSHDADAFGEIVRRWERKIFALCFGMLSREEDARDASQETFIAAYRNIGSFRGDAKVSSWLHRIAVNQCLTIMRRRKARPEDLIDEEQAASDRIFSVPVEKAPGGIAERKERIEAVRRAVNSLPFELKEVVIMKEFEEMTFQEISETLSIPLSTVKSRVYTALRQLRSKLEKSELEVI